MGFWQDIQAMSVVKLILLAVLIMLFLDMLNYYISAFFGRASEPYPLLYEMIKWIHNLNIWKEVSHAVS